MEAKARILLNYRTAREKEPFREWLRELNDAEGRARIRTRLDRVEKGNFGNHRSVGEGVLELRFNFGPGYRVYFGEDGDKVILLCGGDKNTQEKDIRAAKRYWKDYNAQENE